MLRLELNNLKLLHSCITVYVYMTINELIDDSINLKKKALLL